MTRRFVSLIAADPARRVVGNDNVQVRFYNGRSDVLATAYLALVGADTVALPMRANPGVEHFVRVATGVGDTTIEVDSTTSWAVGDVLRFRTGSTQTERAIKTVTDTDTIVLDAAIGFVFPIGAAIRGQVGHARIAVDDVQDYSADVQNVSEGWRSVRVDYAVLQTAGGTIAIQEEGASAGSNRPTLNYIGAAITAADDIPNNRMNITVSAPTQSSFDDHSARHDSGGADVMAIDAAAATGSLRTLGTGANQAAAGTQSPTVATFNDHNARHEPGGGDPMAVDAAVGTGSLRTLGAGAAQAAVGTHTHVGLGVFWGAGFGVSVVNSTISWGEVFGGGHDFSSGEAFAEMVAPTAMTITEMHVRMGSPQPAGGNFVITLRKNAADTTAVRTINAGAAAGTYSVTGLSISVAAGDLLVLKLDNQASSASGNLNGVTFKAS